MNGHWNSLLNFHLWQLSAQENSFPLLPGTLTVPVTIAQLIIHIAGGFNPSISARAISSSPRVSAFSLYILVGGLGFCLKNILVGGLECLFTQLLFPKSGIFHIVVFHSAIFSSSPTHCWVWLQLGLITHSVCPVSITITLIFTVIPQTLYNPTIPLQLNNCP